MKIILCLIDFWFYIHKVKPLTKIKYYKRDVPNKYWGRCLLDDMEVAPYYLIYCGDPAKIKITEEDKKWAKKMFQESNFFKEEK